MTFRDRQATLLRWVLVLHGVITLAGAVVLTVFPTAIPAAVGVTLQRPDYLIVYLVAAAELAAAVLSFGGARLDDPAALRLIVTTLVVLHVASGLLNIVYMAQTTTSTVLIANTCMRFIVAAVLIIVWRTAHFHHPRHLHQTYGTSR
jgi:hypothetical protein